MTRIFATPNLIPAFSDRMLKRPEDKKLDSKAAEVAAIAAGIFAALGVTAAAAGEGAAGCVSANDKAASNWKTASRREGLR